MISLNTGVPGSGKTLNMVEQLARLIKHWQANPDEIRPVYVLGIPELKLDYFPCPLKSVQLDKAGAPSLVPDWEAIPDGALIIIDECQGVFPPRSSQTKPPEHVSFLNTHRHRGFDLWITTQNPKLIDPAVRALVGRHQHFRRIFGMQRSIIYEWDACSDGLSGLSNAVKTYWPYPTKVFDWYKSAEIHNKQKFKKPLWIWFLPAGPLLALYFVPAAWNNIGAAASGKIGSTSAATTAEVGQVAAIAATPPGIQLVGYYREDAKCFGIRRNGEIIEEPEKCREKLK